MGHRMARRFDELGMTVFAGCLQSEGKGALELKDVCSKQLHIVPLDITNDEQVKKAVEYVEANLPPGEKGCSSLMAESRWLDFTEFKDVCSKRLHIVPLDITNDEQMKKAVEYVEADLNRTWQPGG
ncbi:hypothetical protein AVEN_225139-1 [Araneus ventricosus]|uniref:Uncharacterized protein n=1 Tax=Araneus ventricosus TaxID=182803 RepID=A0A4Y2TD88_ARAVE|nr:hypothetical protein AVEN_225139-1 [Araneus ventricosus]